MVWEDIIAARSTSRDTIVPKLRHPAALAQGTSRYRIPRLTEHVETNLRLMESILGAKPEIGKDLTVEIEGIYSTAMQAMLAALEKEPVTLLYAICKEPVPDHHLHVSGYLKEVALRALLSTGLLERQLGGRLSIYSYKPTPAVIKYYRILVDEGWG
ncbi:MAG: hypothetical protein WBC61_06720, partial [Dehalococcoidia bacterium]